MILEEETFERYGYYPSDLKPKSSKRILAKCDECGKVRIIKKHDYHPLCKSCVRKGNKHPNWKGGKVKRVCEVCKKVFFTSRYKVKMGEGRFCSKSCAHKGKNSSLWKGGKKKYICENCGKEVFRYPSQLNSHIFCSWDCYRQWRSANIRGEKHPRWKGGLIKRICETCGKEFEVPLSQIRKGFGKFCSSSCARKKQRIPTHHTSAELIFEKICKKYNIPFHYVGDGQLWIGKKEGEQLNPDFIEANGKKICVEILGDYWHSPLLNQNLRVSSLLSFREKHYKRYKWHPIFLWETDLKREDAEAFVLKVLTKEGVINQEEVKENNVLPELP